MYLAGKSFGARASAQNFSQEELAQAVEYCHQREVRVHVTVNTLLKDQELPEALAFVEFLCSLPVDAVLVQDLGLLALLRERAPGLPLHASTQMSLHTPAGVRLAQELGACRVVLARELSLPEIQEIAGSCSVELEAFVHGALCMCLSGQCYLSAMLGGRSGNRGQCAQPCRLPFSAGGSGQAQQPGHCLSLKDLSFIQGLARLREAGVCSAKIEGRMKRPEYVAAATAACRLAADGQPVPPELLDNLQAVFSRSGFTDGYLTGRRGGAMFGVRRQEDVQASGKALPRLRELYRAERQSVPVDLVLQVSQEYGSATLVACRADQNQEQGERAFFQEAFAAAPLTEHHTPRERAEQQLRKTGGTPFYARSVTVPEEGVPLPVSVLNQLRRGVLEVLLQASGKANPIPFASLPLDLPPRQGGRALGAPLPLRAMLYSPDQLCPEVLACEELALPVETDPLLLDDLRGRTQAKLLLYLPRGVFGWEKELRALMEERMAQGFQDFLCGSLGAVQLCRELGAVPHGSFALNAANTAALDQLARLGLQSCQLSMELAGREAARLGGSLPRGLAVYGRQALMLTRNCPLASAWGGCQACSREEPGYLTDRKGKRFPVLCRRPWEGTELLNSVPLWLGGCQEQLAWADFGVLHFTVENPVECGQVLRAFRQGENPLGDYTRGLFRRGVE